MSSSAITSFFKSNLSSSSVATATSTNTEPALQEATMELVSGTPPQVRSPKLIQWLREPLHTVGFLKKPQPTGDVEQIHPVGGDLGMILLSGTAVICGGLTGTAATAIGLTAAVELFLNKPCAPFNPSGQQNLDAAIPLVVLSALGIVGGAGYAVGGAVGACVGACCFGKLAFE